MAVNSVHHSFLCYNIGIKHDFLRINICWAPREALKPEPERRGFQHLSRGPADVNVPEKHVWLLLLHSNILVIEWTPNAVFSRVAIATSENTSSGVHDWNKIRSYTEKLKFSVSFMPLLTIIRLLPTLRFLCQKIKFFPSHFASIWSCSTCLGGVIWGKNVVLYLPKWGKIAFKAIKRKKSAQKKMLQSVIVRLTSRAEKALVQRNKWRH